MDDPCIRITTADRVSSEEEVRAARFDRLREQADADAAGKVAAEAPPSEPAGERDSPAPIVAADVVYSRPHPAVRFWLEHPFRRGRTKVSFIDLVPPTYADVLATVAGLKRHTETFAAMSALTEAEIAALRWPDAERLIKLCHLLMPDLTGV